MHVAVFMQRFTGKTCPGQSGTRLLSYFGFVMFFLEGCMEHRTLGRTGVRVSPLSLGAPQSTFELLMSRISSRIPLAVPGRPMRPRRLFHFQ